MKTWHIYGQMEKINQSVMAAYFRYAKVEPLIQQLYHEPNGDKRFALFSQVCALNPKLYEAATTFFELVWQQAKEAGSQSVHDWIMVEEQDRINWKELFQNKTYKQVIQNYVKKTADNRRAELGVDLYHPWDLWYLGKKNTLPCLYTEKLVNSFQEALKLVQSFYQELGLKSLVKRIHFVMQEGSPTCSRIDFHKGRWKTEIFISEIGVGALTGSLAYIKGLIHEMGHIVQCRTIREPEIYGHMPPSSVSEIVSMFFERLFMRSDFFRSHIDPAVALEPLFHYFLAEDQEQLARVLSVLDLELRVYDLVQKKELTPEALAQLNKDVKHQYYGFDSDNKELADHSWQRNMYYWAYSPFKNRSYVIGNIFSYALCDHFRASLNGLAFDTRAASQKLKNVLKGCCEYGCENTWDDYMHACGITQPANNDFVVGLIRNILEK